jgi:5-formyltetrahydrofolate cyclo-ligase
MPTLQDEKKRARAAAILQRDAITLESAAAAARLAKIFLQSIGIETPKVIAGFSSFGSEIDVAPLLARLSEDGHEIVLPVVVGKDEPLIFRSWRPEDPTVAGPYGIRQPTAAAAQRVPGILLVPLLAFDREGYRLGYGGGYYDRTLAALRGEFSPLAIGIGFASQELDAVPRADYDQRLDWVITDRAAIKIGG